MQRKEVIICNKLGLHARAAAKFVILASQFESTIHLVRGQTRVNGKSIMGVMMLAAGPGVRLEILASGADEEQALAALAALIEERFGEQD
jgi:phosphocarrier protein